MPALNLSSVSARSRLPARRDPYWQRVRTGAYLGYRHMTEGRPGTWLARYRDAGTGKQHHDSLGDFAELPASDRWDAALKAASTFFDRLGAGGSAKPVTVGEACTGYVKHLKTKHGEDSASAADTAARFKRWVDSAPIAKVELTRLTRGHVTTWRSTLQRTAVTLQAKKGEERKTRDRAPGSVNRDMTALRAALNHALAEGWVTSDFAWSVPLRPIENADGRRTLYLDLEQRRKLVAHAAPDVAAFLRGLALLPLRPGALADLTVASFDRKLRALTIGKDKAGNDRRITLPKDTAAFFEAQAKDKLPSAPLLARADGSAWNKDAWKYPIKDAARAAELPAETTAYSLRHSVITDLVSLQRLDLLTVAQLAGTSVAMIERHYGHLLKDQATAALAALAI